MSPLMFLDNRIAVHAGDCREVLKSLASASIDAVVTDPPYGLKFMGKAWDAPDGAPFAKELWAEVLRVLKPGGYLLAFSGTRTYHRMAVAIEDAGFEVRDQMAWAYGSGFPKSLNVSKAIDKAKGLEREVIHEGAPVKRMIPGADQHKDGWEKTGERSFTPTTTAPASPEAIQWEGWGTALKPAWEPICVGRKPFKGTVVDNVLAHGTGALNIDGCRVSFAGAEDEAESKGKNRHGDFESGPMTNDVYGKFDKDRSNYDPTGRWPANIAHDGSSDVLECFPGTAEESVARFFYTAKADADDRIASKHPTIKPLDLMQYYVRLVTPKGGTVLDPFAGTGTTGEAAWREGFNAVLIERDPKSIDDITRRMQLADNPTRRHAVVKSGNNFASLEGLPLFGGSDETDPAPGGGEPSTANSQGTDDWTNGAQAMSEGYSNA